MWSARRVFDLARHEGSCPSWCDFTRSARSRYGAREKDSDAGIAANDPPLEMSAMPGTEPRLFGTIHSRSGRPSHRCWSDLERRPDHVRAPQRRRPHPVGYLGVRAGDARVDGPRLQEGPQSAGQVRVLRNTKLSIELAQEVGTLRFHSLTGARPLPKRRWSDVDERRFVGRRALARERIREPIESFPDLQAKDELFVEIDRERRIENGA